MIYLRPVGSHFGYALCSAYFVVVLRLCQYQFCGYVASHNILQCLQCNTYSIDIVVIGLLFILLIMLPYLILRILTLL